jgi:hypothetical protein
MHQKGKAGNENELRPLFLSFNPMRTCSSPSAIDYYRDSKEGANHCSASGQFSALGQNDESKTRLAKRI